MSGSTVIAVRKPPAPNAVNQPAFDAELAAAHAELASLQAQQHQAEKSGNGAAATHLQTEINQVNVALKGMNDGSITHTEFTASGVEKGITLIGSGVYHPGRRILTQDGTGASGSGQTNPFQPMTNQVASWGDNIQPLEIEMGNAAAQPGQLATPSTLQTILQAAGHAAGLAGSAIGALGSLAADTSVTAAGGTVNLAKGFAFNLPELYRAYQQPGNYVPAGRGAAFGGIAAYIGYLANTHAATPYQTSAALGSAISLSLLNALPLSNGFKEQIAEMGRNSAYAYGAYAARVLPASTLGAAIGVGIHYATSAIANAISSGKPLPETLPPLQVPNSTDAAVPSGRGLKTAVEADLTTVTAGVNKELAQTWQDWTANPQMKAALEKIAQSPGGADYIANSVVHEATANYQSGETIAGLTKWQQKDPAGYDAYKQAMSAPGGPIAEINQAIQTYQSAMRDFQSTAAAAIRQYAKRHPGTVGQASLTTVFSHLSGATRTALDNDAAHIQRAGEQSDAAIQSAANIWSQHSQSYEQALAPAPSANPSKVIQNVSVGAIAGAIVGGLIGVLGGPAGMAAGAGIGFGLGGAGGGIKSAVDGSGG